MTDKELIEHLKLEIKRVKTQRNIYEQKWLKTISIIEKLKQQLKTKSC